MRDTSAEIAILVINHAVRARGASVVWVANFQGILEELQSNLSTETGTTTNWLDNFHLAIARWERETLQILVLTGVGSV